MPIPLHSGFDAKWTLYYALLRVGDAEAAKAALSKFLEVAPEDHVDRRSGLRNPNRPSIRESLAYQLHRPPTLN